MTGGADRRRVLTGFGALGLVGCTPAKVEPSVAPFDLSALEARHGGRIGVSAVVSGLDRRVGWRAGERFLYCSSFKLFLAAATLQRVDAGQERLDRTVPVTAADILNHSPVTETFVGREISIEALCKATVEVSDNGAANLLIRAFGGLDAWRAWHTSIGDSVTRVDRWEPELNRPDGVKDTTTPTQAVANLEALYRGQDQRPGVSALPPALLRTATLERLDGWLVASPTGPGRIKGGVAPGMVVAHKTGTSGRGHVIDIGMIRPRIGAPAFIAVYVEAPAATAEQGETLVAEATRQALTALQFPVAA